MQNVALKLLLLALCCALMGAYIMRDKLHAPTASVAVPATEQYSSEEGVSFTYPSTYKLSSATQTVAGLTWDSVEFVDAKNDISLSTFSDAEGLSLEQFIKTKPQSNYRLSQDGSLTKSTIGGEPSLAYQYADLQQQHDVVAILHNHRVFIFSESWTQTVDQVRRDFGKVLSSVQFQ